MTSEEITTLLDEVFFSWGKEREAEIKEGVKFAHYTSAQVAMNIITAKDEDRCLWLRNAMLMNDFSEIEYGQSILRHCLGTQQIADQLAKACNDIDPSITAAFDWLGREALWIKRTTYLLSLALHKGNELHQGKLSMWRAYGGDANVCILLNYDAFMTEQTAYDVMIAPVDYGGPETFLKSLSTIIDNMASHKDRLSELDPDLVKLNLKHAIDTMILTTKHPGFEEENEWRIIHRTTYPALDNAPPSKIVNLNGIVQKVYYLPMKNLPDHNVHNADINSLLHKIIIGPTPNPDLVWEGFVTLLGENGVENAADKVDMCRIPLRR